MAVEAYFHGSRLIHYEAEREHQRRDEEKVATDWLMVDSSNVKAICYRPGRRGEKQTGLGIWFAPKNKRTGRSTGKESVYFYPSASFEIYQDMKSASSKGKYVHQVIIPNFPHDGPYPPGV